MAPATAESRKALQYYFKYLGSLKQRVQCSRCEDLVLPRDFERHCGEYHAVNTKLSCAWCFGGVTWESLAKTQNADHLFQCCREFLRRSVAPTSTTPFDSTVLCPEKDRFGRTYDPQPRAYDPVWPLRLPPVGFTYDLESLSLAAGCVRSYLERKDDIYWCHVIVRGIAFQSFCAAMDDDAGQTRTAPFFCWCDGGKLRQERYRRHRHMIAVSPSQIHFKRNILSKICVSNEDRPDNRIRNFHTEPIESPLHLVHALAYVCRRKSICEFSGDRKNSPKKDNHFYIYRCLPRDYRLPLMSEWPGGVQELLSLEMKNMKWSDLMKAETFFVDGKWRILVASIPRIAFGKALPLTRDIHPCEGPTELFHHLLDGEKQYYERRDEVCDTWIRYYDVVQNKRLTLLPYHQKLLHEFKPIMTRNEELEIENARLSIDSERALRLRTQLDEVTTEKMDLRKQLDEANAENRTLHGKIHELSDEANARLERELDECRKRNAEEHARLERELEVCRKRNAELTHELAITKKPRI